MSNLAGSPDDQGRQELSSAGNYLLQNLTMRADSCLQKQHLFPRKMLNAKGLSVDLPEGDAYIETMNDHQAATSRQAYRILGRSIGKAIERLRERKGWTQEELVAELRQGPGAIRLHPSGLSKIENGHRMPRANLIFAICQALGLEMTQFWQWEARVREELLGELDRGLPTA